MFKPKGHKHEELSEKGKQTKKITPEQAKLTRKIHRVSFNRSLGRPGK